jgi:hypothetical protein
MTVIFSVQQPIMMMWGTLAFYANGWFGFRRVQQWSRSTL